ncbi:hypothetical protein TrST_g5617 [Triparma strigata]|uniref:Uncharacterized protein n=1 Tax=Triparma strigata TaxID=1606541 RepID=A0A9W6ZHU6_9STRA|nr:hypothetical protein TrST_g5617 [Triparma strigata]
MTLTFSRFSRTSSIRKSIRKSLIGTKPSVIVPFTQPSAPPTVQVQMPAGGVPGQQMIVQGPNGPFTLTLPSGISPGTTFSVLVPLPPLELVDPQPNLRTPPPLTTQ